MTLGLIKIRGDKCWLDLTCMDFHYEARLSPILGAAALAASLLQVQDSYPRHRGNMDPWPGLWPSKQPALTDAHVLVSEMREQHLTKMVPRPHSMVGVSAMNTGHLQASIGKPRNRLDAEFMGN
ncbi:hypothetical protein U0070_019811 [Myodes glareolus]|uniref:Lipase maturation factor n=1 Tax=Myodes glareolus TaxID=447135 RepID=A0AAW0H1A0_MYOGA